ncbi:lectin BRA-3-like isoform X2 [Amphibalanus amphitrite]|uniref:lectin BRA-3-like isoform X2 n=1 Tax=Amphibalanus amphitrite TaxID=1232801 RepID=UPI001C8FA9D1|nr:lectin BRA-3-like isoform X2 [Amphibalanus amphitrite]
MPLLSNRFYRVGTPPPPAGSHTCRLSVLITESLTAHHGASPVSYALTNNPANISPASYATDRWSWFMPRRLAGIWIWQQLEYGSCYYGSNSNFSWHGARQICEEMQWGAHLTSITTDQFGHLQPWIGLNDVDTEGDWKWANGESLVYTNWDAGQPDNTDCDCAYIWKTEGGAWDDTYCNVAFHFVCELTAL